MSITEGGVTVRAFAVDWGSPEAGAETRFEQMAQSDRTKSFYLNPETSVTSPIPSPEFFRAVRKAQARWCRRFTAALGRSANLKRIRRDLPFWPRQFLINGLLVVKGRLIAPHDWSRAESSILRSDPSNSQFSN